MLININPLLSPDLLHTLRSMGHRHDLAIVDANFPADSSRARIIRLDGVSATDVLDAVLSVMPLEVEEPASAWRMIADSQPEKRSSALCAPSPTSIASRRRPGCISPLRNQWRNRESHSAPP